jgi:hypothetical protein
MGQLSLPIQNNTEGAGECSCVRRAGSTSLAAKDTKETKETSTAAIF